LSLTSYIPVFAADMDMQGMDMSGMDHSAHAQDAENNAVGVIAEIDTAKGVLTISHEAIKSLGWPAMTMDFVLKDKKLMGKLSKGQKVQFSFVKQQGKYLITKIK
jgi:Cu(I)/Ag(I) efflux system protein CusF